MEEKQHDGVDIKGLQYKIVQPDKFQIKHIGEQYDQLTAITPVKIINNNKIQNYTGYRSWWLFKCSCGNLICRHLNSVNDTKKHSSCGCYYKKIYADKNIGKTYNYLTIIALDQNFKKQHNIKSSASYYKCKCKCGNYKTVRITALTSGEVKSCGCLKKEQEKKNLVHGYNLIDLTGQTFGNLTVLYKDNSIKSYQAKWICQCKCGNIVSRGSEVLRHNKTRSCGCLKMSVNEHLIADILSQHNINYLYDSPFFSDLVYPGGGIGRFDFILLDNNYQPYRLIEYDGQQHFQAYQYFGGEDKLNNIKLHDSLKNDYALQHNLPLVRIPYNVVPTYQNLFSQEFEIKGYDESNQP